MKVSNTVPIPNPNLVSAITDGTTIKLIGSSPYADLITLDPESLGLVSRFSIDTPIHTFYSSCIDNDCVYLPTKLGQILAVDQFSGEILTTINLGMPIMSDVSQDNQNIYCICGVPISRKWDVFFDNFCVCICDKETGRKKIQTSYFSGTPSNLLLSDSIWVLGGEYLIEYSLEGEYRRKAHLGQHFEHIIDVGNHIVCVSSEGLARSLDKNKLEAVAITQAQPCLGKPHFIEGILIWVTPEGICHVNFQEEVFRGISAKIEMLSESLISPNNTEIFCFDKQGSIVSFNLDNHAMQSIKLTTESLRKPVIAEGNLLVASMTQLHQLKVD